MSKKPGVFVRSRLTLKLVVVRLNYIPFDSPRSALSKYHSRFSNKCQCVEKRPWAATSTLCAPLLEYGDFKSGQRGMLNGKYQTRLDGIAQVYFQDPDSRWIEVNDAKF